MIKKDFYILENLETLITLKFLLKSFYQEIKEKQNEYIYLICLELELIIHNLKQISDKTPQTKNLKI